jgi:N-acetylneuraminate synthase
MKIILEVANNHMGSVAHGKLIVDKFSEVIHKAELEATYFIKFQYRDLENYFNPGDAGLEKSHYYNRFQSTKFRDDEFEEIKKYARESGFMLACTPFDKISAEKVVDQKFDMIKIASACIDDWELHEAIERKLKIHSLKYKPCITFSTGGASLDQVDRLASFYNHRYSGNLNILHCVAKYPCDFNELALNKILELKTRYPYAEIGYSAHELPAEINVGSFAYALGARIFEKHVCVDTDKFKNNNYSVRPNDFFEWLKALKKTKSMCGETYWKVNESEVQTVQGLKRGAVYSGNSGVGEIVKTEDVRYFFPKKSNQLGPEDLGIFSKEYRITQQIGKNEPLIIGANIDLGNPNPNLFKSQTIAEFVHHAKGLLRKAGINYKIDINQISLSHHFGIEKLFETGCLLISRINNDVYSKKIVVQLPNQSHPEHKHIRKDETFEVLYGELWVSVNNEQICLCPGETLRIPPNTYHSFKTHTGVVFEEVSTTAYSNDSEYSVAVDINRKSYLNDIWDVF